MTETALRFNPETGKPNPVSVKEWYLMDRKATKHFLKPLAKKEGKDFAYAIMVAVESLPLEKKREYARLRVAMLERRNNISIADKLELAWAKLHLKQISLPEKKPIFFRKLRTKRGIDAFPKWLREKKSPYLIGPSRQSGLTSPKLL